MARCKKDTRGDLIIGRAKISGYSVERMSAKSGIKRSTMYSRLKLPGTLTLNELQNIDRTIGLTDEEIITLVRNK